MNDYISRDAALQEIEDTATVNFEMDSEMYHETMAAVRSIPDADVVEVVRCRDCFYYHPEARYCENTGSEWDPSGFCSDGERKDGADNETN